MSLRRGPSAAALIVAAVIAATPAAARQGPDAGAPGKEFFEFEIPAVEGGTISAADLKGRIVVVDVWGTWCGPCRQIIPHLIELKKQFGPKGVEVVGISAEVVGDYDTALKRVKEFALDLGINYRLGMMNEEVYQEIRRVMRFEGDAFTVPTTLVLGPDGAILARYPGYFFGQEKEIAELLNQSLRALAVASGASGPVPAPRR